MTKLNPCPMCGCNMIGYGPVNPNHPRPVRIDCQNPDCGFGMTFYEVSMTQAVDMWNKKYGAPTEKVDDSTLKMLAWVFVRLNNLSACKSKGLDNAEIMSMAVLIDQAVGRLGVDPDRWVETFATERKELEKSKKKGIL